MLLNDPLNYTAAKGGGFLFATVVHCCHTEEIPPALHTTQVAVDTGCTNVAIVNKVWEGEKDGWMEKRPVMFSDIEYLCKCIEEPRI